VRKYIQKFLSFVSITFLVILALTSCNKYSDLGLEILPGTDLINVKNVVIKDSITAYANLETGIVTSKSRNNLLGNFNDPLFGTTNANFATQLRTLSYPDFGTNPEVDSSFLFLYYGPVYGDIQTEQHVKIYELLSGLDVDAQYTQDVDLKSMASTQPIGVLSFTPKIELDSTYGDTIIQVLKIPLDNSIAQKILDADSLDKVSNDAFLNYFKGVYVESETNTSGTGSLITIKSAIDYITALGSSYSVDNPYYDLQIYYKNDESKEKLDPDTLPNGLLTSGLYITEYSARVSNITHNYTGTPFVNDLDKQVKQENNIYIQPTGGLKSSIWIGGLSSWRDSTNVAINKAELVFQVDTTASDIENYPPPSSLVLTFVAPDNEEYQPEDYYFNPYFYDGSLDTADYTYHFNITQHIQRVIDYTNPSDTINYVGNQGFYLTTGRRADDAKRVILEGTKRNEGVKFIVTYSEYLK